MPAVGSQMVSDVSSGIRRYTTLGLDDEGSSTGPRDDGLLSVHELHQLLRKSDRLLHSASSAVAVSRDGAAAASSGAPRAAASAAAVAAATRHPVHPETVSTAAAGVVTDAPERKYFTRTGAGASSSGAIDDNFQLSGASMYLEGGAYVVPPTADFNNSDGQFEDRPTMLEKVRATQGIWFLPEIDRQTAETYLRAFEIGVFIIRASSLPRTLALSVNIPRGTSSDLSSSLTERRVEHYLIESTGQLSLEGSDVAFSTLPGLVEFYTENRNELPVPLCLPHLIAQVESREDLLLLAQVANPADFWSSAVSSSVYNRPHQQQRQSSTVNIDISSRSSFLSSSSSSQLTTASAFSMLLDATTEPSSPPHSSSANFVPTGVVSGISSDRLQLPQGSAFARKVRDSTTRSGLSSGDSSSTTTTSTEDRADLLAAVLNANVVPQSRLSSKVSDYEDVWSLADDQRKASPDYTMPSSLDGSTPDRSSSLEFNNAEPGRAKAVGLALRDLDALGDWIENELHDQRGVMSSSSPTKDARSLSSATSTPDSTNAYENYNPDVTAVSEENRVIRRGKRRFAKAVPSSRNRFSAPNLCVTVEDLIGEPEHEHDDGDVDRHNTESIYSSVRELSDDVTANGAETQREPGGQPADDFVCYTPPRKCVPCKDPNLLEAFHSKVGALKRIGSKLLARKSSLNAKTNPASGTLPRESPVPPSATAISEEKVLVYRAKKTPVGYDSCWPVDNGNWNVINRTATPTSISGGTSSSGTSSSAGSAAKSAAAAAVAGDVVNGNGKYLSIRSSKSPAGSLPKRPKTFSDFSDPSRDLEREVTLERTVTFVVKNTRSDFALSLQINAFLQQFAASPAENPDELFTDLRLFLTTVQTYILTEHRTDLEDFMSRDLLGGSPDLQRPSHNGSYVVSAAQRLIVEPLCPKLIWNLQNKIGTSGDFSRLEKGCAILEATEPTMDDIKPEIQEAVTEKLSALTSHFKSLAEAQNLLTKAKQLVTVFSDIFGIEADPLEYSFTDTISAFAMAIAKAKAYNVEVHLDFIWQLQAVDGAHDGYLPVLLAASYAATVLKDLASNSKLRLSEAIARCMTPVAISIKSRDDCPVISHNFQVPLDQRLLGNQLTTLLASICDLNSDSSDMTLRLNTGCLGLVQAGDVALKSSLSRWRSVYPDCRLLLMVQTKKAD
ncbi:putative Protein sprint [Hypsibius exemplaris]|uniref:SH2 domain-containing protein n=1 Tax=Hypsibius exemplaris TaxID=2072580 RepID=A0A1W0WNM9_HYPEX|nr:putative Protein sprint [Hypsibius exemplaris]